MRVVAAGAGLLLCCAVVLAHAGETRVYHVDDARGDDARDGLTAATAWQTIARVNRAELAPGDTVVFLRGGIWRGQLVPRSGAEGAPITYGAYGEGPRPRLLGSAARDQAGDWVSEGDGLWRTAPITYAPAGQAMVLGQAAWSLYDEGDAQARLAAAEGVRVECEHAGTARNHVQLSASGIGVQAGRTYLLRFRARATGPIKPISVSVMSRQSPWTAYAEARVFTAGGEWSEVTLPFEARLDGESARVTLFLGDVMPAGSALEIAGASFGPVRADRQQALDVDVGNIILDGGAAVGFKKWEKADLKEELDFWYDPEAEAVSIRCDQNPAKKYGQIELALRRHIIDEGGKAFVTYEDLALLYGGAHGIGGGTTRGITARRCDISFIGGGLHGPLERRVRYGNGIEFWEGARDCLVEDCRIWEIYDAALTNQGSSTNVQENIVYRRNVIWNAEYSFEYWNREDQSVTRGVRFERNTCVDAGKGWGHRQRPDRNGRHLMFFRNTAKTSDFVVRGNIFAGSSDSLARFYDAEARPWLSMDGNCWYQPEGVGIAWGKQRVDIAEMAVFLHARGFGRESVFADPQFVNAGHHDYRLAPGSPAAGMGVFGP